MELWGEVGETTPGTLMIQSSGCQWDKDGYLVWRDCPVYCGKASTMVWSFILAFP